MTAGNNGSGTPDNDDPFAYLYRSEGGTGGGAGGSSTQQPGVPRTSFNQVRPVGERRYGGQQAQQPQQPGRPNAYYAAPETVPGGRAAARQGVPAGRGRAAARAGRNHNGLLIGAIAVVAAVIVGVGSAIIFSDDDKAVGNQAGTSASPTAEADSGNASEGEDKSGNAGDDEEKGALPKEDAASLRPEGGATVAKDIEGSRARSGAYVAGLDKPGASVSWVFDVPEGGKYTLYVGYGVPGKDANSTLTVNGRPQGQPLNMKNFAQAEEGQWDKGWTRTYAWIELTKGTNTVSISCEQDNQCGFVLDQVWLEEGHVKKG
ncbi:hypothetical protein [Streptomyces megasporus]|uniref:hypothetical protein n=1 Tax=Streptomyces megasporus TaxID=44060 RepID=UPI0004E0AF9A|nr:hypothetical protein [Streptomyces megasporus]